MRGPASGCLSGVPPRAVMRNLVTKLAAGPAGSGLNLGVTAADVGDKVTQEAER